MLTRLLITNILALVNLLIIGQTYSWSDSKSLDGFEVSELFCTTDSTLYIVKQDDQRKLEISYDIFHYDMGYSHTAKASFEVDEINHISMFNNTLHVFGIIYHGKEDELIVFQLDSMGTKTKELSLLKCAANGGYHANFDVSVSPNGEYCAIIGSDGYTPDQKEIIHSILYDQDWKEHHHKEIITSVLSQKRSYNAIIANNQGVTYVMKRERKKSADKYYVYCIGESGAENHHELHLKSKNIMDMRFDLDTLGELYIAGFYASPYKSSFEGIYVKKLNPDGVESFSKEYMLNENVISAFNSKKDLKEYGYGLRRFRTGYFGFIDDKNLILEAEHRTKEKNKDGTYTHIQNGFVVISLSNKGGFQYATPIQTMQTDEEYDGFWSSHCHVNLKGRNLIFLNLIGEGTKGVKEDLAANAHLYTFKINITDNGVEKRELVPFDAELQNHAIYSDFDNHTDFPLLIIKSKEKDQYALGMLVEE